MAENTAALLSASVVDGTLMFRLSDGSAISCNCIKDAFAEAIAKAIQHQAREIERLRSVLEQSRQNAANWAVEQGQQRKRAEAAERELAEARRMLAAAVIKVAELPGPTKDTVPENQLNKISKFTALQLGHAMGIADAVEWLRHAARQRGEEG